MKYIIEYIFQNNITFSEQDIQNKLPKYIKYTQ